LKLRSLIDAYDAWEEGLKLKEKLRKSEICLCVAIVIKNIDRKSFPSDDPDFNPEHMRLSRQGWKLFCQYKAFADAHPECANQMKRNGEWKMQEWYSSSKV
jgi:hypothetical protein